MTVSFTVTNSGSRAGSEVAQVYAALPAALGEPPQRLVAWQKIALQPGQQQPVSLTVPAQRLMTREATKQRLDARRRCLRALGGRIVARPGHLSGSVTLAGS